MYAVVKGTFTGNLLVKEVVSQTDKTITLRHLNEIHTSRMKKDSRLIAIFESREAAEKTINDAKLAWDGTITKLTLELNIADANLRHAQKRRLDMIREAAK